MYLSKQLALTVVQEIESATGLKTLIADTSRRIYPGSKAFSISEELWPLPEQCKSSAIIYCADKSCEYRYFSMLSLYIKGDFTAYLIQLSNDQNLLSIMCRPAGHLASIMLDQHLLNNTNKRLSSRSSLYESMLFSQDAEFNGSFAAFNSVNKLSDESLPEKVVVTVIRLAEIDESEPINSCSVDQIIYDFCNKYSNYSIVPVITAHEYILICGSCFDTKLKNLISELLDSISKMCHCAPFAGISIPAASPAELRFCFQSAAQICPLLMRRNTSNIAKQDELFMQILIESIPIEQKKAYIKHIFKDTSDCDIAEWAKIDEVIRRNNDSISKSAAELYIHKNTLQYRIAKIYESIGYDIRNSSDAFILRLGFLIRDNLGTYCE